MNMIKNYCKEFLITAVLLSVIMLLLEFIPSPEQITEAYIYSPMTLLLGMLVLFMPFFVAIVGGFLISKKTNELKPAIVVPASAVLVAGLLLMLVITAGLLMQTDADWQKEFGELNDSDMEIEFFPEMTLEQFKSLTLSSMAIGIPFIAAINFGLGLAGGFVGRALGKLRK